MIAHPKHFVWNLHRGYRYCPKVSKQFHRIFRDTIFASTTTRNASHFYGFLGRAVLCTPSSELISRASSLVVNPATAHTQSAPYTHLTRSNHSMSDWHGPPESQGDSGPKPKVAAKGLPWVHVQPTVPTASRLMISFGHGPKVGSRTRQPWAGGLNPFGIAKTAAHLSCKIRVR